MTCLSICTNAIKSAGFAAPGTINNNSDGSAILLLALLNKAGQSLSRRPWQALQKEHTFSTVASTASYALPSDFGWYENDTAWDRTNYWQMRGSLTPGEWQRYKSGTLTSTPRSRFRVKGKLLFIDPTPTSVRSIVLEYVSNGWTTNGSTFASSFTADTETSVLDEFLLELELTWRFLERKGFAYEEAKDEAQRQIELALGHDVPKNTVNLAGDSDEYIPPYPTLPSTGYA